MIVLDTNIISEVNRKNADVFVRQWFDAQDLSRLYLCATTVAEMAYGADRVFLRDRSQRYQLELAELVETKFRGRILMFETRAAIRNGNLRSKREAAGRPIALNDAQIAAICLVHGATLATRNVRDFDGLGLKLVNPFEA
jgi:toxin FitB